MLMSSARIFLMIEIDMIGFAIITKMIIRKSKNVVILFRPVH